MKHVIFVCLCCIGCVLTDLSAQFFTKDLTGKTIEEIMREGEAILSDTTNPNRMREYKHYKRWEIDRLARLGPGKTLINSSYVGLREFRELEKSLERMKDSGQRSTHGEWEAVMPTQFSKDQPHNGRINVIAVHPNNENVLFIGAATGGLWKSTDAGNTWTCLTDGLPVNSISGIAIHPTHTNTLFILTGDGDGRSSPCGGILRSTDGGYTWQATGLIWNQDQLRYGFKLLMNPVQPNIMYAATTHGIYRTSNSWSTYDIVSAGLTYDIEFKPGDPNVVYASTQTSVLRSTNGGLQWTNLSFADPVLPNVTADEMTRIALGVSPHQPSWVYALMAWDQAPGESFVGLFASTNAGDSWAMVCDTQDILGRQTRYDLVIAVDPVNVTRVFAGGVDLFYNYNITVTDEWERRGEGWLHADLHDLMFTESYIYAATDGGMSRSADGGTTWVDISEGLDIAQIYDFDLGYGSVVEGSQDNGTMMWTLGDIEATWISGGDGFECIFHPTNPDILYASSQNYRFRSMDGGMVFHNITPPGDANMWDASWIMHPFNPDTLYAASTSLSRTFDRGTTWVNLNPGFTENKLIRAMAQGVNNPERLYLSDRLSLRRTSSLNQSQPVWIDISDGLPFSEAMLGALAVDPDNANRVWCTFLGYGSQKVFFSSNGGYDWTDITDSLPHVPVRSILYQQGSNDGIYIGTDLGVFYRNANLSNWIYFSNGLPVVAVEDMKIYNGYLYVATYGRGVWRSTLYTACPVSINLTPMTDPSNPLSTGVQKYSASHSIFSTRQITGGIGTDVLYQAGNAIRLDPGFEVKSWSAFEAKIGGCPD